ncbi:MAG TPA: DUF3108 domain-containing protein [Bacteroidales bacterium]
MNKLVFLSVIFLICASYSSSQTSPDSTRRPTPVTPISPVPAFMDGEELDYILHYGFIKAGEAKITLSKEFFGNKLDVFHAAAKANTTGLAKSLFPVVDIYESYFDINSNLPLKSIRNIKEGNYKQYNEVYFDHYENTVKSTLSGMHKVPANIHDMVSAFFYVRRVDFSNYKGGEIVSVDTYFGDEVFPFYIVFKGRETVNTDIGKFKCLKFVPIVEPGRIFKESDDMTFWLSDDENKIPVRVKFDMIVGSFKCDISGYKNNKYVMKSRITK